LAKKGGGLRFWGRGEVVQKNNLLRSWKKGWKRNTAAHRRKKGGGGQSRGRTPPNWWKVLLRRKERAGREGISNREKSDARKILLVAKKKGEPRGRPTGGSI